MLHDPTFWVAIALVVFVIAVFKPVSKMVTKGLDDRAEKIKDELDEAERLRDEAADLLAQYQRKQRDAAGEAEAILQHAKEEAERMDRDGRARIKASLERREKLAMDRIALAEQQAIERVRARAVDIAIAATEDILKASMDAKKSNALIDEAIGEIPERLH